MTTPRLQLPELAQNQAQPHLTVNGALRLLDVFAQAAVTAIQNTPPGSPADGNVYIVGTSPTGDWTGQANRIAAYVGTAWTFIQPRNGFYFYNIETASYWRYNSGWFEDDGGGGISDAPSDSQTYGRRNGDWTVVGGGGGGVALADGASFSDDFLTLDNWATVVSGSGAAVSIVTPENNQAIGVARLSTGTDSNGRAGVYLGSGVTTAVGSLAGSSAGGVPTRMRFRMRFMDNPRVTEDHVIRWGFGTNPLGAGGPAAADSLLILFDTEFRIREPDGTTENTGLFGGETSWFWIEIYSDGENPNATTVRIQTEGEIHSFELDEMTSIPGSIFILLEKTSGSANRSIEVDYASLEFTLPR